MFMVFYIVLLYFEAYAHYFHTASLWYCTIMNGRILEVSVTLTLNERHEFICFLILSMDFEILGSP